MGDSLSGNSLDAKTMTSEVQSSQSLDAIFSSAKLQHFDNKNLESKDVQLSHGDLYADLKDFTGHPSFREKANLPASQAVLESHLPDSTHFDNAKDFLQNRVSKQAMEQEKLSFVVYDDFGLPGEKMSLSNLPVSNIQDGNYLVHSCVVRIASAVPRVEVGVIRP